MNVLKEYKAFSTETGEIKIVCRLYYDAYKGIYYVVVNDKTTVSVINFNDAKDYYEKLLEMDKYIASKVNSYEVYVVVE